MNRLIQATRWILIAGLVLQFGTSRLEAQETKPPNVVMIVIDDLNDWIGALAAHPQAITPHIDRLANEGVLFTQAFATSPLCGPSRAAFLSGMRASTTGFYDNKDKFVENKVCMAHPNLPQFFKANGYETIGAGKIFHHDYPQFWDKFRPNGKRMYQAGQPRISRLKNVIGIFDYGPSPVPEKEMDDYLKVSWAREQMAQGFERPFFLAVGLYLPHLPWYAPQKYFDLLPPVEDIYQEPVLANDLDDLPSAAVEASNPTYLASVQANGPQVRPEAVRAYLAATAFVDAQVGRLMEAIDQLPDRDNTIVVLFGDHGNHFGTKHHWHKGTLWEESLRVPLIIRAPRIKTTGARCVAPVSLLDIYPTLAALCQLPEPTHLEGISLVPMLENPSRHFDTASISHADKGEGDYVSLRTADWRYTQYGDGNLELYHVASDPEAWHNLAGTPGTEAILKQLQKRLVNELNPKSSASK